MSTPDIIFYVVGYMFLGLVTIKTLYVFLKNREKEPDFDKLMGLVFLTWPFFLLMLLIVLIVVGVSKACGIFTKYLGKVLLLIIT
jgi:hypothetical protein